MSIEEHKWDDVDITTDTVSKLYINLHINVVEVEYRVYLNKADAIAIARHFGLTESDLTEGG